MGKKPKPAATPAPAASATATGATTGTAKAPGNTKGVIALIAILALLIGGVYWVRTHPTHGAPPSNTAGGHNPPTETRDDEVVEQTGPQPFRFKTISTAWTRAMNVSQYDPNVQSTNGVLMRINQGMSTEQVLLATSAGTWVVDKDGKADSGTPIHTVSSIQFKSRNEDENTVTLILNPKH